MTQTTDTGLGVAYIDASQVCERYGKRSRMWLWRTQSADPDFPKPMQINGRNYWRLEALLAWEARRSVHAT